MKITINHISIDPNNYKSIDNIMKGYQDYTVEQVSIGKLHIVKNQIDSTQNLNHQTEINTTNSSKKESKEDRLDREAEAMRRKDYDEEFISDYWNWMTSR